MKIFFSYLKVDIKEPETRKALIILFSSIFLMILYIYQGNHEFYLRNITSSLPSTESAQYYSIIYQFLSIFFLFLIIPVILITLILKEPLMNYGICSGDIRFGLKFLGLGILIVTPVLFFSSKHGDFLAQYPMARAVLNDRKLFLHYEILYLLYYIAWEFFFRGFMQIGLSKYFGLYGSIAIQTMATGLLHIGKPQGETIGAFIFGPIAGACIFRSRSVVYLILFHYYMGVMNDIFCYLVQQ